MSLWRCKNCGLMMGDPSIPNTSRCEKNWHGAHAFERAIIAGEPVEITSTLGRVDFCSDCGGEYQPPFTECGCAKPTTSQTILSQAQEIIAGRHERYGDCTEVFAATNEMFAIYRGLKKGETSAHDTAVFNIIQKLVRIGSGQNHQDNWIDIAGYAATGGEVSDG